MLLLYIHMNKYNSNSKHVHYNFNEISTCSCWAVKYQISRKNKFWMERNQMPETQTHFCCQKEVLE